MVAYWDGNDEETAGDVADACRAQECNATGEWWQLFGAGGLRRVRHMNRVVCGDNRTTALL